MATPQKKTVSAPSGKKGMGKIPNYKPTTSGADMPSASQPMTRGKEKHMARWMSTKNKK